MLVWRRETKAVLGTESVLLKGKSSLHDRKEVEETNEKLINETNEKLLMRTVQTQTPEYKPSTKNNIKE